MKIHEGLYFKIYNFCPDSREISAEMKFTLKPCSLAAAEEHLKNELKRPFHKNYCFEKSWRYKEQSTIKGINDSEKLNGCEK